MLFGGVLEIHSDPGSDQPARLRIEIVAHGGVQPVQYDDGASLSPATEAFTQLDPPTLWPMELDHARRADYVLRVEGETDTWTSSYHDVRASWAHARARSRMTPRSDRQTARDE